MRYGIVIGTAVQNVIEWDGVSQYQFPDDAVVVQHDSVDIGWAYVEGQLVEPVVEIVNNPAPVE